MNIIIHILDLDAYLQEYTADGFGGQGNLSVTNSLKLAKRYPDMRSVLEEWKSVSTTHPIRPDGKPNRPLSAYTISTVTVP
jgi:hypothetical protein